jgi:hypothetical protein
MAMELFVLSDKQLSTVAEWQAAIDGEGYPLRLDVKMPIEALKGFFPVQLRDKKTGFECGQWPADKFMREKSEVKFGHDWKYVLTFRWGGDLNQVQGAWMAAAAYAAATNGVVFDEEEGKIRTPSEAQEIVQGIERDMPKVEELLRRFGKT